MFVGLLTKEKQGEINNKFTRSARELLKVRGFGTLHVVDGLYGAAEGDFSGMEVKEGSGRRDFLCIY